MPRVSFGCLLGLLAWAQGICGQGTDQPAADYSNGALEMTVEHAKPDPRYTRPGQNLYGILTISLKNVSDEPLQIVFGLPNCDFAIDILDSSGEPPKLTPLGERLLPKSEEERVRCPIIGARIEELEPGNVTSIGWDIKRFFQLDPQRPYAVKVTWEKGLPAATPSGRPLRRQLSRILAIQ